MDSTGDRFLRFILYITIIVFILLVGVTAYIAYGLADFSQTQHFKNQTDTPGHPIPAEPDLLRDLNKSNQPNTSNVPVLKDSTHITESSVPDDDLLKPFEDAAPTITTPDESNTETDMTDNLNLPPDEPLPLDKPLNPANNNPHQDLNVLF